jgi:hypothetical protein
LVERLDVYVYICIDTLGMVCVGIGVDGHGVLKIGAWLYVSISVAPGAI